MATVILCLIFLKAVSSDVNLINLNTCKITHTGTEYTGTLSKTESNVTCQQWTSATEKGSKLIVDKAFPDGSKVLAKNYCRNPNKSPKGPWCYTKKQKLLLDTCKVPLCKSPECRVTGTGMEYTGAIQKSSSGKKCKKWKDHRRFKKRHKESPFEDKFFADGSVSQAGRKCRNPDGNRSGPWCYVEADKSHLDVKELCDIPFCDDLGTIMYSQGSVSGQYFFFSSINESQSFNINFRLWDPSDWHEGQVFLYLSAYDIAADREDLKRWSCGVEIMLNYSHSGIFFKNEATFKKIPLILSGAKWTNLEITWVNADDTHKFLRVIEKSRLQSIAISEIPIPGTVFEISYFRFFSVAGSPALWNLPTDEEECFIHTVSRMHFTRFWLVKKTTLGKNIEIFVRAKEAVLLLRSAPMVETYQIQVTIGDEDKIKIFVFSKKNQFLQLAESSWPKILDFWSWKYLKITILKDKLQLFWVRKSNTELLIKVTHADVEKVMWVTFASPTVSYWTIYCDPRGFADPSPATPPECIYKKAEVFKGTLSVTISGRHCIPWTDNSSLPKKYRDDDLFKPLGGRVFCQNFCRNLDNDAKGPYCVVRDFNSSSKFSLEYCNPRPCSAGDCKVAGTGNDYVGKLNITRSKRECKVWKKVEDDIVLVANFPDPTLEDAGNFCRNPNKSTTGSWCFTTDPEVPRDECFIKDCDKPLECTILLSGYERGTFMYILPPWRKYGLQFWLKAWNPDIYEGLMISLLSIDKLQEYHLLLGSQDNEKLELFYRHSDTLTLISQKTLPHLVPAGKWAGYWLRPAFGKIEIGYRGVANSFFEWTCLIETMCFEPMFLNFGTIQNHWIGVNFQCTECLVEETSALNGNRIYPINLWKDETVTSGLLLNLRGKGAAYVTLMLTPELNKYLGVKIHSNNEGIFIISFPVKGQPLIIASFPTQNAMAEKEWSKYNLSFTESVLTIRKDGIHLLEWTSPFPLLYYWFAVSAEGTVNWSANCPFTNIDGEPRDGNWGKWSPWSCSVTCGKGQGRTERLCNNPPPNVFGKECKGPSVYQGPCNDFPCGQITPETNRRIRQYLSSQFKSLEVEATERVVLTCNDWAISLITTEVSEMNITWIHNGFPYARTRFHMDENYSLVIPHAQEKHNGVYLCMAYQGPNAIPSKVVLEVVSLVVIKSKPTKKVLEGRSLTLKCNGLSLSYVYADLSQRWELNGTLWKDYGLGTLQTVFKLENISDAHAGVWTCVVTQEDFKFKWKTNWMLLKVKSAPNFWSHLMQDVTRTFIFGKLNNERDANILFFIILVTLFGITFGAILFSVKCCRK